MDEKKKIEELILMIDNFMESGGGHMNVTVEDSDNLDSVTFETVNSTCQSTNDMACQVPTLHEGFEDLEQEQ